VSHPCKMAWAPDQRGIRIHADAVRRALGIILRDARQYITNGTAAINGCIEEFFIGPKSSQTTANHNGASAVSRLENIIAMNRVGQWCRPFQIWRTVSSNCFTSSVIPAAKSPAAHKSVNHGPNPKPRITGNDGFCPHRAGRQIVWRPVQVAIQRCSQYFARCLSFCFSGRTPKAGSASAVKTSIACAPFVSGISNQPGL